jgi:hypothetical protein
MCLFRNLLDRPNTRTSNILERAEIGGVGAKNVYERRAFGGCFGVGRQI